jgi:nicotinate phosphoribosyltransferase
MNRAESAAGAGPAARSSMLGGTLLTDLYQLTMAQVYFERGMNAEAVFDLFVRTLPRTRNFLLAAGLPQALEYLQVFGFDAPEIDYLASLGRFSREFLDYLATVRFSGSVLAMPEGTPFFAGEPIVRVTAPLIEAQLIESRLLNLMHLQTLIASKAARFVLIAEGRRLIDFGMRRAHGAEAALYGARAAYLAGFDGTATVQAGERFGLPLSGTMAHSFIEAHISEEEAFRAFVEASSSPTTLLLDTYDCQRAARRVVQLVRERRAGGKPERVGAVRIDSGELAREAHSVRQILDQGDCTAIEIVLSGGLDERQVQRMLAAGAPVDAFGIGTDLMVSQDAPALDMAYKLASYGGEPRRKRSPGKATLPGCKQVYRVRTADGEFARDSLGLEDEALEGEALLQPAMRAGRCSMALPSLAEARRYCQQQLSQLPPPLRQLESARTDATRGSGPYPVQVSERLLELAVEFDARDRAE